MQTTLEPVKAGRSGGSWRAMIEHWPAGMAKSGVLVTAFGESIPFSSFMVGHDALLLERQTPDSLGARLVVLGYDQIVGLKLTQVISETDLREMGFSGKLTRR